MPTIQTVENAIALLQQAQMERARLTTAYKTVSKTEKTKPPTVSDEEFELTPEYKASLLMGETIEKDSGSYKELCPKCGGGENRDKAFSISRDVHGYLYWNCFRASCGYKGSTGGGSKGKRAASRESNPLTQPIVSLCDADTDYFVDEYGIDAGALIKWCPEREAFVFPIKSGTGATIGHQLRWFDGRTPKSLSYPVNKVAPFMAHYAGDASRGVIVVEDPLSAMKVSQTGHVSVALLGTNLDYERAYEIRKSSEHMVLALDRGTLDLALKYRDKFSNIFEKITIWSLDKDLKYVVASRIGKALYKGDVDFITSR